MGMSHQEKQSYWLNIVTQCNQSEMSKSDWMAEHNINPKMFYSWQKKLRDRGLIDHEETEDDVSSTRFIELVPPASVPEVIPHRSSTASICHGDISVDIDESISDDFLIRIIRAVKHA